MPTYRAFNPGAAVCLLTNRAQNEQGLQPLEQAYVALWRGPARQHLVQVKTAELRSKGEFWSISACVAVSGMILFFIFCVSFLFFCPPAIYI
jgi:hypothetical protein